MPYYRADGPRRTSEFWPLISVENCTQPLGQRVAELEDTSLPGMHVYLRMPQVAMPKDLDVAAHNEAQRRRSEGRSVRKHKTSVKGCRVDEDGERGGTGARCR